MFGMDVVYEDSEVLDQEMREPRALGIRCFVRDSRSVEVIVRRIGEDTLFVHASVTMHVSLGYTRQTHFRVSPRVSRPQRVN